MHDSHASDRTPPVDGLIAALARRQHGVVARRQLLGLGVGQGAVAHRVRSGRLHRVLVGVYAVGHDVLTTQGRFMAATLACESGVLSHRSAALHWGLLTSGGAAIEVTALRERSPGPAVRVHRSRTLRATDVTVHDGIPITTVARTLLDLADVAPARLVERALDQAEVLRRFDLRALDEQLARASGRRGAGRLRVALAEHRRGPLRTRSQLEEDFLALIRASGLPRPQLNARVCGFEVDAYWPAQRLAVELDGSTYHQTRRAFEADRERDVALLKAGVRTARITTRRVRREPGQVLGDLGELLTRGG